MLANQSFFSVLLDVPPKGSTKIKYKWLSIYGPMIPLVFSRYGTPIDIAHMDSFNNSLREVGPDTNWFMSPGVTREIYGNMGK